MGARFFTVGRGLAWPGTGPVSSPETIPPTRLSAPGRPAGGARARGAQGAVYQAVARRPGRLRAAGQHEQARSARRRTWCAACRRPYQLTPEIYRAAIDEAKKLRSGRSRTSRPGRPQGHDPRRHRRLDASDRAISRRTMSCGVAEGAPNLWYIPAITPAGSRRQRATSGRTATGVADRSAARRHQVPGVPRKWGRSFEKTVACRRRQAASGSRTSLLSKSRSANRPGQSRRRRQPGDRLGHSHGARSVRELGGHDTREAWCRRRASPRSARRGGRVGSVAPARAPTSSSLTPIRSTTSPTPTDLAGLPAWRRTGSPRLESQVAGQRATLSVRHPDSVGHHAAVNCSSRCRGRARSRHLRRVRRPPTRSFSRT